MKKPGDIIEKAKITHSDVRGRYWFESGRKKGYIYPDYIPDNGESENENIKNLVCIKGREFALCNYEAPLAKFFYHKKNVSVKKNLTPIWIPRWRQGAVNPFSVICEKPQNEALLPPTPKPRNWRFVRMPNKWIMPVLAPHYYESAGKEQFYPSDLSDRLSSVYFPELHGNEYRPPMIYKADLKMKNSIKKEVTIYLHGTLDPIKWHYGVWNHLLGGTPNASPKEKAAWEAWLNINLPNKKAINKIFNGCKAIKNSNGGGNCKSCNPQHFQEVHKKIKWLLELYWKSIVTFWESDTTKQIKEIKKLIINDKFIHSIDLKISGQIKLKKTGTIFPLLILKGWSYDFNMNDDKPAIFHLSFVTFYIKPRNPLKNNTLELKNVKRLSR